MGGLLIQSKFNTAMGPLRQDTPFDFGNSRLLKRVRVYSMTAKLRARIALRPMVEAYCRDMTPQR